MATKPPTSYIYSLSWMLMDVDGLLMIELHDLRKKWEVGRFFGAGFLCEQTTVADPWSSTQPFSSGNMEDVTDATHFRM